jgi:hypothetical protein
MREKKESYYVRDAKKKKKKFLQLFGAKNVFISIDTKGIRLYIIHSEYTII